MNNIYPWNNSLRHIRRIYQQDGDSDILLYPSEFSNPIEKSQFEKYFHDETRMMKIPSSPCLLRWQYQKCIDEHWPNLVVRENPILERSILTLVLPCPILRFI
jgi:hypothetical protein